MQALDHLKERARAWLTSGQVDWVVGYGAGSTADRRRVKFVRSADEVEGLVLDEYCRSNLAAALVREGFLKDGKRVGVFLSSEGIRSVNVLCAEEQVDRSQILILGFEIDGKNVVALEGERVGDFDERVERGKKSSETDRKIAELRAMSGSERFAFWREQFSKCIKCYACRQSCPMCYCRRCIVEQNQPQWITPSAHSLGNLEWNIVRAFHLAGRCVECGDCERACPAGIPLMLINRYLTERVWEDFEFSAGSSADQEALLASFKKDDPDTFFV